MSRLDLVTLLVSDPKNSLRFYRELLGLELLKDSGGYVELASGALRLALFPRDELEKLLGLQMPAAGGALVLSFEVEELDERFESIVERGAEPVRAPAEAPWGKRVGFVRDPDGNLVELYEPPTPPRL